MNNLRSKNNTLFIFLAVLSMVFFEACLWVSVVIISFYYNSPQSGDHIIA